MIASIDIHGNVPEVEVMKILLICVYLYLSLVLIYSADKGNILFNAIIS